jgi:T5SS/PEP-CTERM-associated repeat protein
MLIEDGGLLQTTETAATLSAPAADIAADPDTAGSSVTVTGTNSTWQIGGPLVVGDYAAGSLSIGSGGTLTATQLEVGAQATGAGTIDLSGAGSILQVAGFATIGGSGTGILSLDQDAVLNAETGTISVGATGTLLGDGVAFGGIQNRGLVDATGGPAIALLNGTSIRQLKSVDHGAYFHIELETHDIIVAEATPCETFGDGDSRGAFYNAAEYQAMYPQSVPLPAQAAA